MHGLLLHAVVSSAIASLRGPRSCRAEASDDKADAGRQLLLGYLADRRHGNAELCSSAREFMLCQTFADDITELQKADAPDEQQVAALVVCRETCDVMSRGTASSLTAGVLCLTLQPMQEDIWLSTSHCWSSCILRLVACHWLPQAKCRTRRGRQMVQIRICKFQVQQDAQFDHVMGVPAQRMHACWCGRRRTPARLEG